MKKFSLLTNIFFLFMVVLFSSCNEPTFVSKEHVEIVDVNSASGPVLDGGVKMVFTLENGWRVMYLKSRYQRVDFEVVNEKNEFVGSGTYDNFKYWRTTQPGQFIDIEIWEQYDKSHKVKVKLHPLADYTKDRIIKEVKIHAGQSSEIHGSISNQEGPLKGKITGKSAGGENIVNIYFEDEGPAISINASEAPLWLDAEKGDIVREECIRGQFFHTLVKKK